MRFHCKARTFQPEQSDLGLLGSAGARGGDSVTAEVFDLIEVVRVPLAGEGYGGPGRNWAALRSAKGGRVPHFGAEDKIERRRKAVFAGSGPLRVIEIQDRLGVPPVIVT